MTDAVATQPEKQRTKARNGDGCLYRREGSRNWFVKVSKKGKIYRWSTGTPLLRDAKKFLNAMRNEVARDRKPGQFRDVRVDELVDDYLKYCRNEHLRSLKDIETRWRLHLKGPFGGLLAADVGTAEVRDYIAARDKAGASVASVNRELSVLRAAFWLGFESTPKKLREMPTNTFQLRSEIPFIRQGFLEDNKVEQLLAGSELWFRALVQTACTFGWRREELLGLKVVQVNLLDESIRLYPGTTKNLKGRLAYMTKDLLPLIKACVQGKAPTDYVFTREDGSRVRDFRAVWQAACRRAGVGKMLCPKCKDLFSVQQIDEEGRAVVHGRTCPECGKKFVLNDLRYRGLIFHDLRRTGCSNMIRSGIQESTAMEISGHETNSVFGRYNIGVDTDRREASKKMQAGNEERARKLREVEAEALAQTGAQSGAQWQGQPTITQ